MSSSASAFWFFGIGNSARGRRGRVLADRRCDLPSMRRGAYVLPKFLGGQTDRRIRAADHEPPPPFQSSASSSCAC
jgi:hypothetical protein